MTVLSAIFFFAFLDFSEHVLSCDSLLLFISTFGFVVESTEFFFLLSKLPTFTSLAGSTYKDATSGFYLPIKLSFSAAGGIETNAMQDSSNPPCNIGRFLYFTVIFSACMTAPMSSRNFIGL